MIYFPSEITTRQHAKGRGVVDKVSTCASWYWLFLQSMMDPVLKTVIPSLVEDGIFGDVKYLDLQPEDSQDIGAQFSSTLFFISLTVKGPSGDGVIHLVVKLPYSDHDTREVRNCDTKFHNEVTMFKEILPELSHESCSYPKMYYGTTTSGVYQNVLILENIKYRNFSMSKDKIFLDFDHVSIAIKKLAKFHASSYILKHKNRNKFLQITKSLKDVELPKPVQKRLQVIQFAAMERGIKPLSKTDDSVLLKKCLSFLKHPYHTKQIIAFPEEPYAVICHGDFCNNNILYKYDYFGIPIDCAFLDFQQSRYASPAIDLFFFLYMHTTLSFREKYWDEILELYWKSLKNSLPSYLEIPSLEDYLKHFGGRAIYGYIISSWFLPSLMDHNPVTKDDYMGLSLEEKVHRFLALAGMEGERVITEIVSHLLSKKYIVDFIHFSEKNLISNFVENV